MNDLSRLWAWISERQMILLRKTEGEQVSLGGPWTGDPILQRYRFCNVRREDDRVTKWIADNIRKPFHSDPLLWHMLCIARTINWPPTLAFLIENMWPNLVSYTPELMSRYLIDFQARGDKVFTGAYMIRAESDRKTAWFTWPKVKYISEIVCGKPWEYREQWNKHFAGESPFQDGPSYMPTLEHTHRMLMNYTGWGPFMAYQAVVDMRFTPLLWEAPDRATWCAAGPGTIRGLNRLAGRELKAPLKQDRALKEIREIWERWKTEGLTFDAIRPDFSDVPNCLCEFDKYERVRLGQGEPRALYAPGRGG